MEELNGLLTHLDLTQDWIQTEDKVIQGLHDARITLRLSDSKVPVIGKPYLIKVEGLGIQFHCDAILISGNPITHLATFCNTSQIRIKRSGAH